MNANTEHINIFIAYSRKDAKYMDKLRTPLTPLELSGAAKIWYDGEIAPGTNWEEEIKKYLLSADITLLLISANSFNSDYFYHEEMTKALQRHQEEDAIVIPVILSDCIWEITDLKHLQALPKDGEPIDHWSKENSAYADIVRGVYRNVELIRDRHKAAEKAAKVATKEPVEPEIYRAKPPTLKGVKILGKIDPSKLKKEPSRKRKDNNNKDGESKSQKRRRRRKKVAISNRGNVSSTLPAPIQDLLRDMIHVKGGTFRMGSDDGYDNEKPVHTVTLDDFKIGKYPITQAQYQTVIGENPSHFKENDKRPVEMVSWNDAQDFIQKLCEMTGEKFRLPTEAEWEFAARGGTKSKDYKYAGSDDIDDVAWCGYGRSESQTHPVGEKAPNELKIYDMSGNVWEWCKDWYGENYYKNSPKNNPKGSASEQTYRILRGGSWMNYDWCVANRNWVLPHYTNVNLGFRLAQTP